MRIELEAQWPGSPERSRTETETIPPTKRPLRRLWYIALTRHIDHLIETGEVASLAEVARMCCVSRARITQLSDSRPG